MIAPAALRPGVPPARAAAVPAVPAGSLLRWVAPAAVAFGLAFLAVPMSALLAGTQLRAAALPVVLTVALAVPYGWLLLVGVAVASPDRARLLLAAALVPVLMGTVLLGTPMDRATWLPQWHAVAVASLIAVGGRAGLGLAVGAVTLPHLVLVPVVRFDWLVTSLGQVAWRAATVFVVLWAAGALRVLQATRVQLAEDLRGEEQRRMGRHLEGTVTAALRDLVEQGGALTRDACPPEEDALRALVRRSRLASAEARSIVRDYRTGDLNDEIRTATALLAAAGTVATIRVDDDRARTDVAGGRTALLAAVRDVLRRSSSAHCTILLTLDASGAAVARVQPATSRPPLPAGKHP